jgi:tRNA(Ile2) C34 agmatinyltransferase TiaS
MYEWRCPKCGYYTNSETMKNLHQHEAKHECIPKKLEKEYDIDDMTKKEIIAELDKKEIEYNKRGLKDELFDLLVGD